MRRTSTMRLLAIAFGTVAFGTPAAASAAAYDCAFTTLSNEAVTGGQDVHTGAVHGYVVSDTPGEPVSIRCYVEVDGVAVASSGTAAGATTAVVAGPLTFAATETQVVDLCAEWTAGAQSGTDCEGVGSTRFPPAEVTDLVETLGSGYQETGYNDGETGAELQVVAGTDVVVPSGGRRGPEAAHDLTTSCTYKLMRQTGTLRVIGKTKAGRHPVAESVSVRCRLVDAATGVVLYDQTRTEPGTLVRLEDTVAANPNGVRICNAGTGFWDDSDTVATPLVCR